MRPRFTSKVGAVLVALVLVGSACADGGGPDGTITVYSGRKQELVGDLIERFEATSGIEVKVRYASSPELAATIREEGDNSPADVFFAVDPASLGTVAGEGLFMRLPSSIVDRAVSRFSDAQSRWVGTSGRARVVVYDTTKVTVDELPDSVEGFTGPQWSGRLAIAPTNGSFLAFVSAMILIQGETATRAWLEAVEDNGAATYSKNSVIVAAVDGGEVEVGLVNHYYLFRRRDEVGEVKAANHFLSSGGPGSLIMPAGAGVLATTDNQEAALAFVEFLLSQDAQRYFVEQTFEYPTVSGIDPHPDLPALDRLQPPDLDLSGLATVLDRATELVAEAGLL